MRVPGTLDEVTSYVHHFVLRSEQESQRFDDLTGPLIFRSDGPILQFRGLTTRIGKS